VVFGTGGFSSGVSFRALTFAQRISAVHSGFFTPFFVSDMFLVVLDLAFWVYANHSSSCFSFRIAHFIAFPIIASTIYLIC